MIKFSTLCGGLVALALATTALAQGNSAGNTPTLPAVGPRANVQPGYGRVQLDQVTPAEADRQARARVMPSNLNEGFVSTAPTSGARNAAAPLAATTSIAELARALRNDVDLIYEYVRNTIDYYPGWGAQKGALGTLIDSQGAAFDQAALMVALLRQAGYTASYLKGTITLTPTQIQAWLGVDIINGCAVIDLMASAGIPIAVPAPNTCYTGALTNVTFDHVWVKVMINGSAYQFDPSFKPHTIKPALNLAAITGYSAASFLSTARAGATITADYAQNINRTGVRSNLTTYANTLATHLRTNLPAGGIDDVLGGTTITPHSGGALRQTALPYPSSVSVEWLVDIPPELKSVLKFSVPGLFTPGTALAPSGTSDNIYGKRLVLTFNSANQPALWLDGALVGTGTAVTPGSVVTATFTVTHPYGNANADQVFTQSIKAGNGSTYFLSNGWGPATRGLVEYMRADLEKQKAAGHLDTSEPVLGATLGVLAATWMAQTNQSALMTSKLTNSSTVFHHQIGIAGHNGSPYVDLPGNRVSVTNQQRDLSKATAAFFGIAMRASVLESAAVQQITGVNAVSTVRLIDVTAATTDKIFDAKQANFSTVQNALVNCASNLTEFQNLVNAGDRLILPTRCNITQNNWAGVGYFDINVASNSISFGARISGGLFGGFASTPQAPTATVLNTLLDSISAFALKQSSGTSFGDPIDMVKGSYLYARNDITTGLGEFPFSLSLQRLYTSAAATSPGPLGLGWTHNLAASATVNSDGFQGLGEDSALDAVAALVEQMVSLDLLSDPAKPLDKMIIATLGQAWLGEQLVNNTVVVKQGINGEVFVKLPDGSYNAPPGSSARLFKNQNGSFAYDTLHHTRIDFDLVSGKIASVTHPSGVIAKFTYSGNDLTQVQNSFGRTLNLTNVGGRVQSVSDGARSVSYTYDGSGNLATFADTLSKSTVFQYDLPGRMTKLFYPSSNPSNPTTPTVPFLVNVYDSLSRVQTQTNAVGKTYNYYFAGTRSEEVDPVLLALNGTAARGKVSYLDERGKVIKAIDPLQRVTLTTYDGQSRPIKTVLPEGNSVEYDYDDAPCLAQLRCTHNVKTIRQISKASALPTLTSSLSYEAGFNNVATATDARGKLTSYTYDSSHGGPLTVTAPADVSAVQPVTTYGYTAFNAPQSGFTGLYLQTSVSNKTSASNTVTNTTAYNDANKLVPLNAVVDSGVGKLTLSTAFVYDAVGNLTRVDGPRSDVSDITKFEYDNERRTTKTINAINESTVIGYDADGRVERSARSLDPDYPGSWMVTCRSYSASGKPLTAWGPWTTTSSGVCPSAAAPTPLVTIAYDDNDRPKSSTQSVIEGGDRKSETDYYADDSIKAVRRGVGVGSTVEQTYASYTYTNNGLPKTLTDAKGNVTTYEYDSHARKVRTRFPHKVAVAPPADPSSATDYEEYGYDNNANVTSLRKRDGQNIDLVYDNLNRLINRNYTVAADNLSFGYDLLGRRLSASKSDGYNISYVWDNAGRLTSTTAGARTLAYQYDAAGNRTRITHPDTGFATTTYDALNRPLAIKESDVALLASYTYFPMSLRKTVTLGNGTTTNYSFNSTADLYTLNHNLTGTAADVTFTYERNQAREISKNTWTNDLYSWRPPVSANGTKTYDAANGQNQYTKIAGVVPGYDANGNLSGDGVWIYGYDADNRLKTATKPGTSATLAYDAEGRMRQTSVGGAVTDLLYDGASLIAAYDNAGNLTERYVHGPGIDEPLVSYAGASGVKTWLYADHLGSVIAQADGAGNSTGTYKYGPFGEPDTTAATTGIRFRYTGQQYLGALDLYHYKARFYSAAMGMFLQTDPIGYADDTNLYGYVGNNPINFGDPSGLTSREASMLACGLGCDASNFAAGFFTGSAWRSVLENSKETFESSAYQAGKSFGDTLRLLESLFSSGNSVPGALGAAAFGAAAKGTTYGPYHRLGDSAEAIISIQATGELVGNQARNYMSSPFPKVKAYEGPLPDGKKGFEFFTNVAPDAGHVPGQPVWMPTRAGVVERNGQAVIKCSVVKVGC